MEKIDFTGFADRNTGIHGEFYTISSGEEISPPEIGEMIREEIPFEFTPAAEYAWRELTQ